jgi:hypothetical protein
MPRRPHNEYNKPRAAASGCILLPPPPSPHPSFTFLGWFPHMSFPVSRLLLVTANTVPSLQILFILIMEQTPSSETSVITRGMRCYITEDGIPHSHRRENLQSYFYFIIFHLSYVKYNHLQSDNISSYHTPSTNNELPT